MENPVETNFFSSPARELTLPAIPFFYGSSEPVPFGDLDRQLDLLLDRLYQAKGAVGLAQVGPDITRYFITDDGSGLYIMEVGMAVTPETLPAGEALVKVLPPFHCAGVLLWGGLDHAAQAYEALKRGMNERGLSPCGETREVNYAFEAVFSPNNLMGIYQGQVPAAST